MERPINCLSARLGTTPWTTDTAVARRPDNGVVTIRTMGIGRGRNSVAL